jgi:hypothetical protein
VLFGESMEHIGFYLKKLKIKLNKLTPESFPGDSDLFFELGVYIL